MSIFICGTLFSGTALAAGENPLANEVASKIIANDSENQSLNKTLNQSVNKSVNSSVNPSVNKSAAKPVLEKEAASKNTSRPSEAVPVSEQKFRVGPTVVLRPVNDVITENQDGLVELYIDNPSLNDVTLNVDARISVPSGIHVYGQGFAQTGAAGTVYGIFSVPPGNARTFYIDIKGDKVGTSTVHFSGLYWAGDNKDNYYPISLTHPFVVEEPSKNSEQPTESEESDSQSGSTEVSADFEKNGGIKAEGQGSVSAPGFGILVAAIGLFGIYIAGRNKQI